MVIYGDIEKVLHTNEDYKYLVEEIKNNYTISAFYLDEYTKFKDPFTLDIDSSWSKFILPNDPDISFTYDNRFILFMIDFINDVNQRVTTDEVVDTINYVAIVLLVFKEIYNLIGKSASLSIMNLGTTKVKVYKNLHFLEFYIKLDTESITPLYISLLIEGIGEEGVKHDSDYPLVMSVYNKDKTNKIYRRCKISEITKDTLSVLINTALDKFV